MTGETENATWPLPKFYFTVLFSGGFQASFQEVSGIESQAQVIEYRAGDSPTFSPIKMPGLARVGNVTLRKGVFANDTTLWDWFNQIKFNTIKRQTVVISLLDETGSPKMMWTLNNAWPTKLTGSDLRSDGNEVAVESIEIAYETLVVSAN